MNIQADTDTDTDFDLDAQAPGQLAPPTKLTTPYDWTNISFLAGVHLAAIVGLPLYLTGVLGHGFTWSAFGIGFLWSVLTVFSLSAGYHRLFSHRAYEAHTALKVFLLAFGAASFQNSALNWGADHRRHHKKVDTDEDPYNARLGFYHSHIGWIFHKTPRPTFLQSAPDLERDPYVKFQHDNYKSLGGLFGFVLPVLVGWALGDAWGGLILGGFVRLVAVYHITFAINSFAHILGNQPYSDRNTARDSFLAAMLSMGEGYHNFHHTFPADYRNGVRAHHFDPSKWAIFSLRYLGLARNLKRTPEEIILRTKVRMDAKRAAQQPLPEPVRTRLQALQQQIETCLAQWKTLRRDYDEARAKRVPQKDLSAYRQDLQKAWEGYRSAYREWCALLRSPELTSLAA